MVTFSTVYNNLKQQLKAGNVDNYIFESRCIAEHIFNKPYNKLILNPDMVVNSFEITKINEITEKRISGYPLQYILEKWEFYGLPFYVGEGVLIPRQDTEILVDCVLEHINSKSMQKPRIIDLCSGTGCIAIALKSNTISSEISAVEYSDEAFKYLERNISLNNVQINAYKNNVLDEIFSRTFSKLDIITSNPPYLTPNDMDNLQREVAYEPAMALAGGETGLLFYERITEIWKQCLCDKGTIFYEIGIGQEADVANILTQNNFHDIEFHKDYNGIIRVVKGVYN